MPIYKRSRKGMGFLPQEKSVFQRLTVEENLLAVLETRKDVVGDRRTRAREMLAEYGLTKVATQKAYTLSGGETRRLEICRAMITNPSILMLDELFSGVDPIAVNELAEVHPQPARPRHRRPADRPQRSGNSSDRRSRVYNQRRQSFRGRPPDKVVADPLVRQTYLGEDFRL